MLLAHADGFSWDEALMVLAPIAILAAVLLYVNTKLQRGLGDATTDDAGAPDGQAVEPGHDVDAATRDRTTHDPANPG